MGNPELALRLETTLGAVTLGAIVGALAVFGLFSLAATIAFFFQLVAVATALGVSGAIVAAVAAAVLLYLLIEILPRTVESAVCAEVQRRFDEGVVRDALDDTGMLRYAGEGMAETVARKALQQAVDQGLAITPPAGSEEGRGADRFRGQTFQIVFMTEGVCRVLLRLDRCEDDDDVGLPEPPENPNDGNGPGTVPGIGRRAAQASPKLSRPTRNLPTSGTDRTEDDTFGFGAASEGELKVPTERERRFSAA